MIRIVTLSEFPSEVVDFVAGKLLDLVGVPHTFDTRWDPNKVRPPMAGGTVV